MSHVKRTWCCEVTTEGSGRASVTGIGQALLRDPAMREPGSMISYALLSVCVAHTLGDLPRSCCESPAVLIHSKSPREVGRPDKVSVSSIRSYSGLSGRGKE